MKQRISAEELYRLEMYRQTFGSDAGKWVLKDLSDFLNKLAFDKDPYVNAYRSGSREFIQQIILLASEENYLKAKNMEKNK